MPRAYRCVGGPHDKQWWTPTGSRLTLLRIVDTDDGGEFVVGEGKYELEGDQLVWKGWYLGG